LHSDAIEFMNKNKPILVTQPALPPLEEFMPYLEDIWKRKWITNNGYYHQELEKALCEYLGVKYISLFTNGTLPLITALQALRITGEVITTPYSFVATTHALWWNGIKPVFVDIDSKTGNLDPSKIEAAITPQTTAIMPVHVYGTPCDTEKIQAIADKYGLKIIYDAAHAFGVKVNGESILNAGDMSTLSFHATKVYNTLEGGALICRDEATKKRIDQLKNFGFVDEVTVVAPGINAKVDEVRAAYGLLGLKHIDNNITKRAKTDKLYRQGLSDVKGITLMPVKQDVHYTHSYFPIFVNEQEYGISRDTLYEKLKENNIFGRRYFYPLISDFPTYSGLPSASKCNLPIATKMANSVICLPMHPELTEAEIENIIKTIIK
jgi:dTDP-4-amino-4,6-dideoxygalactose transaminase